MYTASKGLPPTFTEAAEFFHLDVRKSWKVMAYCKPAGSQNLRLCILSTGSSRSPAYRTHLRIVLITGLQLGEKVADDSSKGPGRSLSRELYGRQYSWIATFLRAWKCFSLPEIPSRHHGQFAARFFLGDIL